MLINYTFNNYLSFKQETTLSLETGDRLRKYSDNTMSVDVANSKNKIDLLKNIIIFGGNGSGKSNLLSSLSLMKTIISNVVEQSYVAEDGTVVDITFSRQGISNRIVNSMDLQGTSNTVLSLIEKEMLEAWMDTGQT